MSDERPQDTLHRLIDTHVMDGFRDDDGIWHDGPNRRDGFAALDVLRARAVRAEAVLRDIPPTDQLRLWLKEDLVGLLGDLRNAGQEGKDE
jgi:hypothetical protein